jgi:acyl-CoA hydrolase
MSASKSPKETETHSRKLVMPDCINSGGSLFGGMMMSWIDKLAAMTAQRHSNSNVVTASIDQLAFLAPVYVGDHVVMKGRVIYVGRTSMEIRIDVWKENPIKGECVKCTQAYLTFVALDSQGKPKEVPSLKLTTEEEKLDFEEAKERMAIRKQLAAKQRNNS